jgi:sugar phosphate isomerase/epimerase
MFTGYRVVSPQEVGRWEADLIQISAYGGGQDNIRRIRRCAEACTRMGIQYVVHPVSCPVLDQRNFDDLMEIAGMAGRALILHDERGRGGDRLSGKDDNVFRQRVLELGDRSALSFENAVNTADAPWFWKNYAGSITLDLGHVEAAGFDSTDYVRGLDPALVERIDYVHMHHNGSLRGGLTDHWPLVAGCRELKALGELLKMKTDLCVILELNETGQTGESLRLLRQLSEDIEG